MSMRSLFLVLVWLQLVPAAQAQSLDDGLIAHYRFDETGSTALDSSEHERHTAISGAYDRAEGVRADALLFNGTNTVIDLGQPDIFAITTYSIAGWFRTDNASRFRVITSRNRSHTNRQWWVTVWENNYGGNPSGTLVFRMSPTSGPFINLASTVRVDNNEWHHFAVVVDSTARTAALYLNGTLIDSAVNVPPVQIPNASAIIGRDPSNSNRLFRGGLDDIRFYNRPLSRSEVGALAARNRRFTDVSEQAGFDLVATDATGIAAGLHVADFNGDGLDDVLITGSGRANLLQRADDGYTQTALGGWSTGIGRLSIADLTGDGRPDAYAVLPRTGRPGALINTRGPSFASPQRASFSHAAGAHELVTADIEGRGVLAIFAVAAAENHFGRVVQGNVPTVGPLPLTPAGLDSADLAGRGGRIYTADLNNDTRPDFLYLYDGGRLMLSQPDGTYRVGRVPTLPTDPANPASVAFADYDNDGHLDAFVTDPTPGRQGVLLRNNGSGDLLAVGANAGLEHAGTQTAVAWGDYDNDGFVDLFIGTGAGEDSVLYRNLGHGLFEPVDEGVAFGGAVTDAGFIDLDHTGWLSLAAVRRELGAVLLENRADHNAHLKVRAVGIGPGGTNTLGIGTRVELLDPVTGALVARRDIGLARSNGSDPLWAHFGGVDPARAYTVRVWFNSGLVDTEVVPMHATTIVGPRTVAQAVTVQEPPRGPTRVVRWQEVAPLGE